LQDSSPCGARETAISADLRGNKLTGKVAVERELRVYPDVRSGRYQPPASPRKRSQHEPFVQRCNRVSSGWWRSCRQYVTSGKVSAHRADSTTTSGSVFPLIGWLRPSPQGHRRWRAGVYMLAWSRRM